MKGYTLTGCGGVGMATGANFLLTTPEVKILVDCGLVQGSRFAMEENRSKFSYNPTEVAFLLVTHAHIARNDWAHMQKLTQQGKNR